MTIEQLIEKKEKELKKVLDFLKNELSKIRTGRASPSLVEELKIDYYGNPTPLIQLATITSPESRLLVIQPWDKNSSKAIMKAIQQSPLGIMPEEVGNIIRLRIPPLTSERREELTKIVRQKLEDARITIRKIRDELIKELKNKKIGKEISEDQFFSAKNTWQEKIDEYNEKIEKLSEEKEKEIFTV